MHPVLSRRAALALVGIAAAQAVAACSSDAQPPEPSPSAPDDLVRREAAAAEERLIAAYDAALALRPEPAVAALLGELRAQHAAHRDALTGTVATASPTQSPAVAAATGLPDLVALERAASRERRESCVRAESPELARLLSLIAASEASHATALAASA